MASLLFLRCVLFPVGLRYGWNLRVKEHQQMLIYADGFFKPFQCSFQMSGNHLFLDQTFMIAIIPIYFSIIVTMRFTLEQNGYRKCRQEFWLP